LFVSFTIGLKKSRLDEHGIYHAKDTGDI